MNYSQLSHLPENRLECNGTKELAVSLAQIPQSHNQIGKPPALPGYGFSVGRDGALRRPRPRSSGRDEIFERHCYSKELRRCTQRDVQRNVPITLNTYLPGDSRSLIVPGIVVRLGLEFASFPLTPTLSPKERESAGIALKSSGVAVAVTASVFFVSEARDNQARFVLSKHGRMFLPLLGLLGRGLG